MGVTSIAWQKPLLYTETAMPHSNYARHLMGSATIDPTGAFEAGSFASFTLTYTAGYFGIDDTGSIKIVHRFASDMGKPQFTDPQGWNYTTVEAGNGAVLHVEYDGKRNIRPWDKTLFIRVVRGYLEEGEQIIVRFGDTRQGSPGMRVQTFHEPTFEFKVLWWTLSPRTTMSRSRPRRRSPWWPAPCPVQGRAAQSVAGRPAAAPGLQGRGQMGQPSDQAQSRYTLRSNLRMARMPESFEMAAGAYAHAIEGIVAAETGDLRLEVLHGDRVVARSNPCRVAAQAARNHYWADLHGQSEETIGTNSAEELILFARDRAFLDAMSHQGNDFQITQEFWEHLNALTARYDEPGRFVIFPGYEWSGNTGLGGDRNVLYLHEGRPLHRSSHALVDDLSDLDSDANSADALFQAIKDEDAVVFAHIGGRYADITLSHDPRIERSIEIHSDWGTFEWLLEDAFKQGYRVGILANSDGHKGRHGASHPGASLFGAYGGLSCLIADTLSRQSLAECLRQRRHYATTGCRAYLTWRRTSMRRRAATPKIPGSPPMPRARRCAARTWAPSSPATPAWSSSNSTSPPRRRSNRWKCATAWTWSRPCVPSSQPTWAAASASSGKARSTAAAAGRPYGTAAPRCKTTPLSTPNPSISGTSTRRCNSRSPTTCAGSR